MAKKRISNSLRGAINRKPKPATLPKTPWDHGASGPANRLGLIEEPATDIDPETGRETKNPNRVTRVRRRLVIEELLARGLIDKEQYSVGMELNKAATGGIERDPLAALGEIPKQREAGMAIAAAIDARKKLRVMRACVILHAPRCWPILEHVCIENNPPSKRTMTSQMQREKLNLLRAGLTLLASKSPWN